MRENNFSEDVIKFLVKRLKLYICTYKDYIILSPTKLNLRKDPRMILK